MAKFVISCPSCRSKVPIYNERCNYCGALIDKQYVADSIRQWAKKCKEKDTKTNRNRKGSGGVDFMGEIYRFGLRGIYFIFIALLVVIGLGVNKLLSLILPPERSLRYAAAIAFAVSAIVCLILLLKLAIWHFKE